jgi:hypothetical protein
MAEAKEIGTDAGPSGRLALCNVPRGDFILYGLVILLALGLDFYRLELPSVWLDEAVTWENVRGSWGKLWSQVRLGEDCGGLVYAVGMKLWTSLFGSSEIALRLPGVLAGVGFVAVLVRIAQVLWGRTAATYVGLFAAAHPEVLCWSRQARAYSFELLFTALSLAGLVLYCRPAGSRRPALLVAATCLLVLTHGFGVFVVLGIALFLFGARYFTRDGSDDARRWNIGPVVPALLLALLSGLFLRDRIERVLAGFWITGPLARNYARALGTLMAPTGFAVFPVVAGWWLLLRDRAGDRNRYVAGALACLILAVLLGPLAMSLLSKGPHNFILGRYCLPCVPLFVLPMGYLFGRVPIGLGAPVGVGGCVLAFYVHSVAGFYGENGHDGSNTRAAVAHLRQQLVAGDRVLVCPRFEAQPLAYYGMADPTVEPVRDRPALRAELDAPFLAVRPRSIWVALYECPEREDLSDLGLRTAPQWKFGTLRLIRIDPTIAVAGEATGDTPRAHHGPIGS